MIVQVGTFGRYTVVDVFIPNKRSKAGKRFAFVRFINVLNLDRLIENLKTIWIGRFYLFANTARFERPKASTFQKEKQVPSGNVTGFKQPIVQNQGRPKESYSSILKPSLVLDNSCLVNRDLTNCVMGEVLQFSSINNLQTSQTENILESFKLIVKGKVFWARAKELFVWSPSFKDVPEKELFSDDESAKINEQANNLNNDEVENASEVVSDTYFGITVKFRVIGSNMHPDLRLGLKNFGIRFTIDDSNGLIRFKKELQMVKKRFEHGLWISKSIRYPEYSSIASPYSLLLTWLDDGHVLLLLSNSTWSSIITEVNSLKVKGVDLISHCKIRVGKGTGTSFWKDLWIGDNLLKLSFPRLFALEEI
ncbi:RNA-directed DNA polymerase, eukaryota, nucleotide-binding alpha-beta plait domain protein [Tanacetum coccineum]|uniref:RNA-directed DNA polymerase, eukaryota, nucleotide-binding alpha-beta plait domain protein n=1 Tax=Tanacetum coccineum TaxID=301880 RepID=A0ABQ5BSY2_9ASTR